MPIASTPARIMRPTRACRAHTFSSPSSRSMASPSWSAYITDTAGRGERLPPVLVLLLLGRSRGRTAGVVVVSARANPAAPTAIIAMPGGAIQPFCEPVTSTSMPSASVSSGRQPAPLTLSTASSLPRPFTTPEIAARSLVTPVEVSLCVTNTVVMSACSARMRSTSSGSIGSPCGTARRTTWAP